MNCFSIDVYVNHFSFMYNYKFVPQKKRNKPKYDDQFGMCRVRTQNRGSERETKRKQHETRVFMPGRGLEKRTQV